MGGRAFLGRFKVDWWLLKEDEGIEGKVKDNGTVDGGGWRG